MWWTSIVSWSFSNFNMLCVPEDPIKMQVLVHLDWSGAQDSDLYKLQVIPVLLFLDPTLRSKGIN